MVKLHGRGCCAHTLWISLLRLRMGAVLEGPASQRGEALTRSHALDVSNEVWDEGSTGMSCMGGKAALVVKPVWMSSFDAVGHQGDTGRRKSSDGEERSPKCHGTGMGRL